MSNIVLVPVEKLTLSRYNPRQVRDPEKLNILIKSINQDGIKNPLLVRKIGDTYEVLDGSRRLQAAKTLGIEKLPCRVEEGEDKEIAKMSLRFHLSQEDLTPEEIINAIKIYISEGIYDSEREACRDLNISLATYFAWKKQVKIQKKDEINLLIEKADIDENTKEIIRSSGLSKEYIKEIIEILEENPRADVKQLVKKYVDAEVREVGENEYEAKGKYLYRVRQAGQDIVFELVKGTLPIGSVSFPKSDLTIIKRLFKKVH